MVSEMKKWLLVAVLCLLGTPVFAQCGGRFPANTICGNFTNNPALPTDFTLLQNTSPIGTTSYIQSLPTIVTTSTFGVSNEAFRLLATRTGSFNDSGSARLIDIVDNETINSTTPDTTLQHKPETLFIQRNFGGNNDGVNGLNLIVQDSAATTPSNPPGWYVGASISITARYGTTLNNTSNGAYQGLGIYAFSTCTCTISGMGGLEVDVGYSAGTVAHDKFGLLINSGNGAAGGSDFVHGTVNDIALVIGATTTSDVGFNNGIIIGEAGFGWPISATGTLIGTQATANARNAAYGIDFSNVTFSQLSIRMPGFAVNAGGDVFARHMVAYNGPTPTAGTCPGFSMNAGGGDGSATINMTSGTSCTVNFGTTFANAPACVAAAASAVTPVSITSTTTSFTVTFGTNVTAFRFVCMGV
jgi:hypothetical protein